MQLLFIVYNNAVDEEVVEIVKKYTSGYSKFTEVQGEGNKEPKLGTHIWPGFNNCIMTAVNGAKEKNKIAEEINNLKVKFKGVGINIFVLNLKEMI